MSTAAARPSSSCAATTSSGADVVVDAREEGMRRRRRLFLLAAMDGNLDLLARMAAELEATARGGAACVRSTCGRQALHLAAANGQTDACRYLVQDLAFPVDAPSSPGETPLLLAATFGHTAAAVYLLDRGASPRATDGDGETSLHWAAYNGDRELAMLLLSRGADVDAANPRGTPLHVAAAGAHPAVVDILLRHGADPSKVANCVFTPLVSSLLGGSLECMKLLIQAMKFDGDTDASLYSNRSICWLHLGIADDALSDAWACIRMRPDWAKGYYRQGMALCSLQDYAGASDALLRASKLDPDDDTIAEALRVVSECAKRVSPSPH
uniref:Uncharacterized protein n=1 Tax=Avena sativa TaxID=4498 RepID=A0ACD6ANM3_AVESA